MSILETIDNAVQDWETSGDRQWQLVDLPAFAAAAPGNYVMRLSIRGGDVVSVKVWPAGDWEPATRNPAHISAMRRAYRHKTRNRW